MRTLRLTLAVAAILTLAVGTASGAVGEPDAGAVPVGIAIEEASPTWQTWEATDPRLSGKTTYRGVTDMAPDHRSRLRADEWTVVNAEGSWTGTCFHIHSDGAAHDAVILVLRGEGAYEGLTAYLDWAVEREGHEIRGVIVGDAALAFPEPPAA